MVINNNMIKQIGNSSQFLSDRLAEEIGKNNTIQLDRNSFQKKSITNPPVDASSITNQPEVKTNDIKKRPILHFALGKSGVESAGPQTLGRQFKEVSTLASLFDRLT